MTAKGIKSLFDRLSEAGLIKQVSPREIIRDIKSGMTNEALMQKYGLSLKGLERVLKDLEDFGLLPLIIRSTPRRPKITIVIPKIIKDLREGMSELDLMTKYDLSSAGLRHAFDKLLKSGAIGPELLAYLAPGVEDTVKLARTRVRERRYPVLSLRVWYWMK